MAPRFSKHMLAGAAVLGSGPAVALPARVKYGNLRGTRRRKESTNGGDSSPHPLSDQKSDVGANQPTNQPAPDAEGLGDRSRPSDPSSPSFLEEETEAFQQKLQELEMADKWNQLEQELNKIESGLAELIKTQLKSDAIESYLIRIRDSSDELGNIARDSFETFKKELVSTALGSNSLDEIMGHIVVWDSRGHKKRVDWKTVEDRKEEFRRALTAAGANVLATSVAKSSMPGKLKGAVSQNHLEEIIKDPVAYATRLNGDANRFRKIAQQLQRNIVEEEKGQRQK